MNTRLLKKLLPAALFMMAAFQLIQAQSGTKAKSSSSGVTGSYSFRRPYAENSLEVQQLADGKVKIYLYASWIGSVANGNVNNGEFKTILPLRNNVAVYESGQCRITIRFNRKRAVVTEKGTLACGFGLNVSAAGTYVKRNSRTPKFDF